MNGSQLIGLDSLGTGIYVIHGYFLGLTVGQQPPGFWGVTTVVEARDLISELSPLNRRPSWSFVVFPINKI